MKQSSTPDHLTRKATIRGMVLPAQWDERFEVTGLLVACRDEREVRVENIESFPGLWSLAQKEALFTGIIRKKGGEEFILLESFTPIDKDRK